jgi:pyrophosphate--fructose-6-phosphate 1-phosphotransferase
MSPLQKARVLYHPVLPRSLEKLASLAAVAEGKVEAQEKIATQFPHTHGQPLLRFKQGAAELHHRPLAVGVVLSGGQAAGGHNVIAGLFDALKKLNPSSRLIGFCEGPSGIIKDKTLEITEQLLYPYRNQGGFDMIGSGRTKIETEEQFQAAEHTVKSQKLDGLVIVGGDDSNTNAALLAEYFRHRQVNCSVVGVPKTIDGDLKNALIEVSFGFDSACKTYSEIIGNILRDALSAKKYYYFIKLMGRSASHIAMECAFQTRPNLALIGEEIEAEGNTLAEVVAKICDLISLRATKGKNYGAILIPEGIVEFIPEVKLLISELNALLAPDRPHQAKIDQFATREEGVDYAMKFLSTSAVKCFSQLPKSIQIQLMEDRDPHGNVQVSKIETERLLMEMVERELLKRAQAGSYNGKFSGQPLFCGYEGRSCFPSNFDSQYCYALGFVAALLVDGGHTGYMSAVQDLTQAVESWRAAGVPITSMMHLEMRHGQPKPVIKKALVDLKGKPFAEFKQQRDHWVLHDEYTSPGPIQFAGPKELSESITFTLKLERDI